MPAKVKVLWVFCNIVVILGFIVLALYSSKVEEAKRVGETQKQLALERDRQERELSKLKKEKIVHPADPLKTIKEMNALGKHEDAVELARKLSESNPGNSNLFTWWGISLVKVGLKSAAIEKFVRSAQLDPANSQAFLYWGLTLAMDGRFQDAIDKYKTVIELTPENSNAFAYMAASLDELAKGEEAVESANKALEINPLNSTAFEVLISALRRSKDYEGAWAVVDRVRKSNISVSEKVIEDLSKVYPR